MPCPAIRRLDPRRITVRRPPSRVAPTAKVADADLTSLADVAMWDGHEIDVNGERIFVRTTPATTEGAEPALFVHGLGGASTNWTDFAALLRDRLAIEALDLPGFGRSGPATKDDYTLQAHADTVIAYLRQSDRGPVHLVGNSMGGAISLLVAEQRPDLVRTLTLISPAVPDNKLLRVHPLKSDWHMGLLIIPFVGTSALRKLGAVPVETRVKGTIALCFADPKRLSTTRYADMVAEANVHAAHEWGDRAMLRSTRGLVGNQLLRGRSMWAAMRRITAPTLVIWGDEDKLVAPDLAPYVAAAIPDSRLLVLEHVGHVAMMEDPQTSALAMIALLDETSSVTPDAARGR